MEKMSQVGVYFYPNRSQADYSEPLQLQILGLSRKAHKKRVLYLKNFILGAFALNEMLLNWSSWKGKEFSFFEGKLFVNPLN